MASVKIENLRTEREQADRLGVTVKTLRRWRDSHYGPAFTKLGRTYYYTAMAEAEFIAAQQQSVEIPPPRRRRAA
jgi:hypothetical protein